MAVPGAGRAKDGYDCKVRRTEMANRKVVDVVPDGSDWKVKSRDASRADSIHGNKADAVARAKDIAKNAPTGQVVIHKMDGKIQTEHTYGDDPYPPKG
jgi:hypothetical protein